MNITLSTRHPQAAAIGKLTLPSFLHNARLACGSGGTDALVPDEPAGTGFKRSARIQIPTNAAHFFNL